MPAPNHIANAHHSVNAGAPLAGHPLTPAPSPLRKAPLFTPYVVVWTLCGALSMGVLGVIGLAPEWLDDLRPGISSVDPQSNQGQRAAARLAADVNALKDNIAQIQLDLAKVKTAVVAQGEQQKAFSAQMTSLERTASQDRAVQSIAVTGATEVNAEAAAAQPAQTVSASSQQNEQLSAAAPQQAQAQPAGEMTSVPKGAARVPKVINADTTAASMLETGSIVSTAAVGAKPAAVVAAKPVAGTAGATAAPIAFGPAVVKAAPQPVGIKLSSGASVDSLRLSWSLLAEKHGDALRNLEARYAGGDAANPEFDLIAGPIKSKAEASKVCRALTAKGVPCTLSNFAGQAL